MKEFILEFVREHLYRHVVIVSIAYGCVFLSMFIDLLSGVRKAKKNGVATTSTGLKKTATKAQKYFTPMLCLTVIDVMASVVIPVPVFTMMWAAYCMLCEFVSVREKSWEKEEIRKAEKTMSIIIENKEDIVKLAKEVIFKKEEEKE